jgi:catalase
LDSAHWPDDPATAAAVQEMEPSPAVLIIGKMNVTLMGRAIGVLVADGSDGSIIKKMEQLSPIPGLSPSSLPLK